MGEIPRLEMSGSPYERGELHGEEFESEIKENVEKYLELFKYYGNTEEEIYDNVDQFIDIISAENESYYDEMRGIADGSGISIENITILNSRYELTYLAWKREADNVAKNTDHEAAKVDGCTTFGVAPEGTASNDTYLAQSWGWKPWVNTFLMDIEREEKPDMVAVTEAGIVGGKIGMNEDGIGIVINGLATEKDGEEIFKKPYHVRFREILDSRTLDKAVEALIKQDRACSANVMVGQPKAGILNIEIGPEEANYLYPEDGTITHTNHIKGDSMNSKLERIFPDSITRDMRTKKLVEEKVGSLNIDNTKEILKDEVCKPSSVCRSIDPDDPEEEQVKTMASMVIDLTNKEIHVADGRPTVNEFHNYRV